MTPLCGGFNGVMAVYNYRYNVFVRLVHWALWGFFQGLFRGFSSLRGFYSFRGFSSCLLGACYRWTSWLITEGLNCYYLKTSMSVEWIGTTPFCLWDMLTT